MSALADLRVLDLTQVLAGPYCTMLLADMGADVVKVERPGGDLIRSNPPFVSDSGSEAYGGYFQSVNRGKRSLELDLGTDEDREAFLSLVERADVVVENFKTGTMEKFDCGYETLTEHNPELIYSSIRGFGDPRTGETDRQGQPSFDLIAQALGGVMEITGQEDGPPTKVGPGIGDIFTAALNAVGILAAVHHRDRTGEGQYVDTAMYDCMVSLAERAVYQYAFEAADGHVVIAAFSDGHWATLCEAMDRPDLAAEYPDATSRRANRESLRAEIADWSRDHESADILDVLDGRVPAAPVQDTADIFEDAHIQDREMLADVAQPGAEETMTVAGSPIKMTETMPQPRGRAPLLDEHREELLDEEPVDGGRQRAESDD